MSSSALVIPVRNAAGERFYLSVGQRVTLAWVFHRVARHGPATLRLAAATLGTTPGVVSKRLDRLAQLGLIGRRSIRGRTGRTLLWIPGRRRVAMRRLRRELGCACDRCRPTELNVPTSTPFGGFLTREGLTAGQAGPDGGGTPLRGAPGRSRARRDPPRLLYARCPLGHTARLTRTRWTLDGGAVSASWSGYCHRGHLTRDSVAYTLPGSTRRGPVPISEVLAQWQKR